MPRLGHAQSRGGCSSQGHSAGAPLIGSRGRRLVCRPPSHGSRSGEAGNYRGAAPHREARSPPTSGSSLPAGVGHHRCHGEHLEELAGAARCCGSSRGTRLAASRCVLGCQVAPGHRGALRAARCRRWRRGHLGRSSRRERSWAERRKDRCRGLEAAPPLRCGSSPEAEPAALAEVPQPGHCWEEARLLVLGSGRAHRAQAVAALRGNRRWAAVRRRSTHSTAAVRSRAAGSRLVGSLVLGSRQAAGIQGACSPPEVRRSSPPGARRSSRARGSRPAVPPEA